MVKRSTVDLDEDDEEEEQNRQCSRWTREEEILLCQCWIENSENSDIGADRNKDSFWGHIMQDFNNSTIQGTRAKNMFTGKWTRVNGDCQKFNVIYKHLEHKSEENEADHIETAKINFAAQSKGRKFLLEHAWRILKNHSKWDAPKPLDTDDHTEIFRPDDLRRKLQAASSAYEAKKEKELAYTKCKELEFLMIDPDSLPEPKPTLSERNKKR
ncbi:hypothetical protein Tco_0140593 [Tanacetum coccineum]